MDTRVVVAGVGDGARELLDWETFGSASRELADAVVADGYEPDLVLAIARGGLLVGGAVAYALGVKNCCMINVEYYTGVDERLDVPVLLPPHLDVVDLGGAHLLIVDDVADTGETLHLVAETVRPQVQELRTAVLYEKSRSIVQCDYVWRRTDAWINFPWSTP
jgi:hypoxanthine phosphoribosyltransferase